MMSHGLLDGYRQRLLDRYRKQVGEWRRHPALADGPALHAPIRPGEWSPHRVLFHACAVDQQAYAPRLRLILDGDRPELPPFDEAAWMADHYRPQADVSELLESWRATRRSGADELGRLPPQAWNRTGRHDYWGERTLQWWVERSLAHADEHRVQLEGG